MTEIDYLEKYLIDALNKIQSVDLKQNTVGEEETDWENLKKETEKIYTSIPTITLDLYSSGIDQSKILNFNKDFDKVIENINKKDKIQTGISLASLYSYLPSYIEEISKDTRKINILKAKSNLFTSYSLIDSNNWEEVSKYINQALENFAIVIGNSNNSKNSYIESKCYIELNEILNSVNSKNKDTFLIKYKNLVEDLENL